MLDNIFYWIGVIVCVAGGLFVTGMFIGMGTNLVWKRLKDVHTLAKLMKIIKENKLGENHE